VGLSEHEQKVLAEMERALYQEDPRFASSIRNTNLDRPRGRRAPFWTVLLALGVIGVAAGVALPQPLIGIAGFVATLAGLYGVIEAALGDRRASERGKSAKPRKSSWSQRAAERFERRRDEQGH
jgi:hypothetical protein